MRRCSRPRSPPRSGQVHVPLRARPRRDEPPLIPRPPRPPVSADCVPDDDDFLFLFHEIWRPVQRLAAESVPRPIANDIADTVMDRVGVMRRTNKIFLNDNGLRAAYILRAVANETKGARKATQNHARLHAMYDHLIARNTLGQGFPAPDLAEEAELDEQEDSALMEYVSQQVDKLAEKCHQVVYLYYVEGKKPREIAKITGIKANSVHSHRRRALKTLREAVRLFLIDHPRRTDR